MKPERKRMAPRLEIRAEGVLHNIRTLGALAERRGVSLSFVLKGLACYAPMIRLLCENGVTSVCEARAESLRALAEAGMADCEKWLIRLPLLSEAADTVRYADVSLNSERAALEALSREAVAQGKTHKAVILLELGELREGVMDEGLLPLCEAAERLPGLELYGIGANLSCINEIVPDADNMAALAEAVARVEAALGRKLPVVSGGSSSAVRMLEEGSLPPAVNHLRIGEAALLGNIVCYDVPYADARTDNFILEAEVIEVKEKPPLPWGRQVDPATGRADLHLLSSTEKRRRAIVAAGYQDLDIREAVPLERGLRFEGLSSDCCVFDVTDMERELRPGDVLRFSLKYHAMVQAMASQTVEKSLLLTSITDKGNS